jgi:DHA2 family multidrug resistance protein
VDPRWLVTTGLVLTATALWQMSRFSLDVTATMLVSTGVIQGLGLGFIFVPLSTMTFATLPADLRTAGTALFSLSRNLGSSIGISVVIFFLGQFRTGAHAALAEFVSPFRVPMQDLPAMLSPATDAGRAMLDSLVTRQATLLGFLKDFQLMCVVAVAALPLVLLMRRPDHAPREDELAAAME